MNVVYAQEPFLGDIRISIFLAGPTPRSSEVKSWRPEAVKILNSLGFEGAVFVPESKEGGMHGDYVTQVEWEWEGLRKATCIVFWVPRDLETMPAFTTNIEWGKWYESGKVVLGYPKDAPKMMYLQYCADANNVPVSYTLENTLKSAIDMLKKK